MSINVTSKVPETRKSSSVALGCVCGGLTPPGGNSRTAMETLCPSRAGNSDRVALVALNVLGMGPRTRVRNPV